MGGKAFRPEGGDEQSQGPQIDRMHRVRLSKERRAAMTMCPDFTCAYRHLRAIQVLGVLGPGQPGGAGLGHEGSASLGLGLQA